MRHDPPIPAPDTRGSYWSWHEERPCAVCGKPAMQKGNPNMTRDLVMCSAVCRRKRKTQLQRAGREARRIQRIIRQTKVRVRRKK